MATTKPANQFGNWGAVVAATRRAAVNLVPPPDMLPSVWAEKNVRIPVGNAIPGPINFDNAPLQRGILDAIKEPGIRRIDLMLAAQTGKTTVQQCITGYFIDHEPRSQIFAQPSEGDMATFQETKLKPMLEANPKIANKMAKPRGRQGVNNSRMISYTGGWLMFSWAGSPKTARGRSAPVTQADEVDGYDVTPEGDFLELLAQRSATYGDDRLDVRSSTPVDLATSRINKGFLAGDQRRWHVCCPDCGEVQYFRWENVHWHGRKSTKIDDAENDFGQEHDPTTAMYACVACGSLWDDGQRIAAIRNAEREGGGWIATKPFKGHASFHAPEMASTFRRLRDIVQSYLDKLALGDLQSFVNVSLGLPFAAGDKADPDGLLARREEYAAQVPMGGLWLSLGVDMQDDRLEYEVVAWGFGEESWSVETGVLYGDPLMPDVWNDLEDVMANTYQHESGALLRIEGTCVDTGGTGGMTAAAYDWLKGKTGRRIFGIKGLGGWGIPIVEKPHRKQTGKKRSKFTDLFRVGVDEAKLVVMRRLAQMKPGPGFCHFPVADDWNEEYFKQLTAERLVVHYVKGQPVRKWVKNDRDRNERLDCRVYAYAALKIMQPSFKRLAERMKVQAPPAESNEQWARRTAETAVKLADTLKKAREATANDNNPAEIPQEERQAPQQDNGRIIRSKRVLAAKRAKGTWATKW
ncbi:MULTISPECIES: phage terminase large subunit family protein [Enterobacteriaceae]|nr:MULTISPECIES: terminase gpA endonuclease subunit [Enterobacteriaceae]MDT9046481.1 terminase gpA endonuclease subunit [Escherichia coli]UOV84348.1 phage terminase large subunit family protein [Klebsiella pneumoniae]